MDYHSYWSNNVYHVHHPSPYPVPKPLLQYKKTPRVVRVPRLARTDYPQFQPILIEHWPICKYVTAERFKSIVEQINKIIEKEYNGSKWWVSVLSTLLIFDFNRLFNSESDELNKLIYDINNEFADMPVYLVSPTESGFLSLDWLIVI